MGMIILRYWKEIAIQRERQKQILKNHTKDKPPAKPSILPNAPKLSTSNPTLTLTSEVSKKEFLELFAEIGLHENFVQYYPILKRKEALDFLFQAFDSDHNGFISLEEFLIGISTFSKGTFRQKAEMIFRSFDLDNSGGVDRQELTKSIRKSIRGAVHMIQQDPELSTEEKRKLCARMDENSVQRTVEHLFSVCNEQNAQNDTVSLGDWLRHSESDRALHQLLLAMTATTDVEGKSCLPIHPDMMTPSA